MPWPPLLGVWLTQGPGWGEQGGTLSAVLPPQPALKRLGILSVPCLLHQGLMQEFP